MLSPTLLIVGAGKLGLPLARRCAQVTPVLLLSRRPPEPEHNIIPFPADVTVAESLSSLPASIEVVVYCLTPARHDVDASRRIFLDVLGDLLLDLTHSRNMLSFFVICT